MNFQGRVDLVAASDPRGFWLSLVDSLPHMRVAVWVCRKLWAAWKKGFSERGEVFFAQRHRKESCDHKLQSPSELRRVPTSGSGRARKVITESASNP